MVPHLKVEECLVKICEDPSNADPAIHVAVTSVPDEKKGERIIVIHTLPAAKLAAVLENLSQCDLPALWRPKAGTA